MQTIMYTYYLISLTIYTKPKCEPQCMDANVNDDIIGPMLDGNMVNSMSFLVLHVNDDITGCMEVIYVYKQCDFFYGCSTCYLV